MIVHKWWLKCVSQRILSYTPFGRRINALWSRRRRQSIEQLTLKQGIYHVQMLWKVGLSLQDKSVLEFGTGHHPVMPYIFRMAGCKKVIICDLHRHMNHDLLQITLRQIREQAPFIAEELKIDLSQVEKVLPRPAGQDFTTLLRESGFEYRAPYDVRNTDYADKSIDIVTTRAVLEHIPPEEIKAIMREMRRILKPTGAMVHTIDHSDHWQHFDRSISRINYLKFPKWWWRVINNPISYQNRLRSCEHVQLIEKVGFNIKYMDAPVNEGALTDAQRLKIDRDYKAFKPEELAVLTTYLVAQPNYLAEYSAIALGGPGDRSPLPQ